MCAVERMQHQQVAELLRVGQQAAQTGDIIGENMVFVPPVLLYEQGRRIVALPDAPQRVALQVRAEEVDPVGKLPLGDPLELLEGDIQPLRAKVSDRTRCLPS